MPPRPPQEPGQISWTDSLLLLLATPPSASRGSRGPQVKAEKHGGKAIAVFLLLVSVVLMGLGVASLVLKWGADGAGGSDRALDDGSLIS